MADQLTELSVQRVAAPDYGNSQVAAAVSASAGRSAGRAQRPSGSDRARTQPPAGEIASTHDRVRLVRDDESGRSFVQIVDRKTGDVIYQIPPEEVQKLAALLKQLTGNAIDTMA